jgi:hypothetical protein
MTSASSGVTGARITSIIFVTDARQPFSSRNGELMTM